MVVEVDRPMVMDRLVKILVVEDEPQMAAILAKGLRDEDYSVDIANDGLQGLSLMANSRYDLVILDVRLPGKDGITVCEEARAQSIEVPILMLTALGGATDTVAGLNCGADDYLPKPFDFDVLLARIRALLRRSQHVRRNVLEIADLSLNTVERTATRAGRVIRLTSKEYALLELLMLQPGRILGRAEIAEHVWDKDFDPLSNIIDVYMNRLRKKIDQGGGPRLLHTRRSEGYMLSPEPQDSSYV
jgi:two-component system copper resistance phosphate regulon response regulator CusR